MFKVTPALLQSYSPSPYELVLFIVLSTDVWFIMSFKDNISSHKKERRESFLKDFIFLSVEGRKY